MMYFLFFLFFPLTSYAYTISVFTDTNQSIAFGQINEELATNFDSNYIEQTIFWKNSNGDILSNAPYLFWIDSNLEPVSFCLLANGNDYCSDFIDLKSTGGEAMSRSDNNYPLSISFLNLENLSIGIQPISKATLNAPLEDVDYIYQSHINGDGKVIDSQIVYSVTDSTLQGRELTPQINNIKACSLVGFLYGSPPTIESCTDMVNLHDLEPQGCIVRVDNGEKYCLKIGERPSGSMLMYWPIPSSFLGKEIYIINSPETAVRLTEYNNVGMQYFYGRVETAQLKSVMALDNITYDFSKPRTMAVISSQN